MPLFEDVNEIAQHCKQTSRVNKPKLNIKLEKYSTFKGHDENVERTSV